MYFVNINQLAKQLIHLSHKHPEPALHVFAEKIINSACEIFNEGVDSEERLLGEVGNDFDAIFPDMDIEAIVIEHLDGIKKRAIECGWDKRIKVSVTRVKPNENFIRCLVKMDLDKTIMHILAGEQEEELPDTFEIVSDNPTSEEMERYDDAMRKRGLC